MKYTLPRKGGTSLGDQLRSFRRKLEKQGKSKEELDVRFKELEEPSIPRQVMHLVQVFFELSSARRTGMNGFEGISYLELQAYTQLMDIRLSPWEVKTLRGMDRAFLEELHEQSKGIDGHS